MKILAIDTATEQCSVALRDNAKTVTRSFLSARGHADRLLPMIDEVLSEAGLRVGELSALAFGRGPGAFTGVRIATAAVQGLATGAGLPVIGISDLAAIAQQHARTGASVLACMDARMGEVYWAVFGFDEQGRCCALTPERVTSPETVVADLAARRDLPSLAAGSGLAAYPQLRAAFATLQIDDKALPHALQIAELAAVEFLAGRAGTARDAAPSYIRNRVVSQPG